MSYVESIVESSYRLHLNPDSGVLFPNASALLSVSTSDPVQGLSRRYIKQYSCSKAVPSGQSLIYSQSRSLRLNLSADTSAWEVWDSDRLLKVISYKSVHLKPVLHTTVGRPSWSFDEQFVVYSAEGLNTLKNNLWGRDEKTNLYRDSYGDELNDVFDLKLFVMNVKTGRIQMVDTLDMVAMHAVFHPHTLLIAYTAYPREPYMVGFRAVTNRISQCALLQLESQQVSYLPQAEGTKGTVFPKFSPDGSKLAMFGHPAGTSGHVACLKLLVFDLATKVGKVVLDVVQENLEHFNGIYGYQDKFTNYNWLNESAIVFQSAFRASWGIFVADLHGAVTEVQFPLDKPYGSSILDVFEGSVLAKCSNYKTCEHVFVYSSATGGLSLLDDFKLRPTNEFESHVVDSLKATEFQMIQVNGVEAYLASRRENEFLLVSMHGGPHGLAQPEYGPNSSVRLALGFNVLEINFSGTTGYGDTFRRRLNGHAGQVEVEECIEVVAYVKAMLSPKKILLHGKSYGGFLSAHLACTIKPDAAVVLNAVSNIAVMHSVSDMDDWGYYVAFGTQTEYPPTPEQYMQMYAISPISKLTSITCPVFLAAGGSDPRVTPNCTLEMFRTLKHLNKDVEFYLFPKDGHAFEQTKTGFELLARTFIWALNKFGSN